ncbi:probable 2-oxoglutarate-dependent dioxygenase AOP1 [Solanum stenotomum]|uniref:probable 2-oxoglutarate-dependent dioxygenase AOP1 n=1 Tax=Solanum stenotomum TaxID=172797 RepID=UPI0020D08D61|nr:probable 2-oxoglutarate-dependent dioxygenase AOP1 [Solanum stenotomum]
MASTKLVKIPTIDFSNHEELKPNTPLWESTKIQVFEALQEYGCFEAIYKVPNEIKDGMFGISKEIFEFPLETKLKNFSEKPLHGYMGMIPQLPLYESLCIPDLLNPQSLETFANIFWPQGNHHFCDLVKSYSNPLVELDEMLKRMISENLELKNYIDELLNTNYFLFRFTHYKGSSIISGDENNKTAGLGGHTDGNFLTFISQNQVNGLQINKNGEWIDVNISPNSCVVLAGDSFKAWTNGRLHSPVHRVTMAGESDRLSIQLFSLSKPGHFVEAPKELVDEEHPLLFKPFEILGLFGYVSSEAGYGAPPSDVFKAYCGV